MYKNCSNETPTTVGRQQRPPNFHKFCIDNLEPCAVSVQPNHFWPESCSKIRIFSPEGNCKCCGGFAFRLSTTVLPTLSIKSTCNSTGTKSCRRKLFQHMILEIRSCRRQKADPAAQIGASRLQPSIAHCITVDNKRGLRTHPCLTPDIMGKLRLDPDSPRTSRDWPTYRFDSIHIMWSEMPWARNTFQRVGPCTRSNAFEGFKLTNKRVFPALFPFQKIHWVQASALQADILSGIHVVLRVDGCQMYAR